MTTADAIVNNPALKADWMSGQYTKADLAAKYGCSVQTVNKATRGLVRPVGRTKRRSLADMPKRGTLWGQIGNDISFRRRVNLDMSVTDFARSVGISCIRLTEIENGVADVTLTELMKISQKLGMTLDQMVRLRNSTTLIDG
jgi:DNA-binding XRE family transcriptional regulator